MQLDLIPTDTQGLLEAADVAARNTSPRAQRLDTFERFVECTQYAGRPSWYDDRVPLWEREPCIKLPLVAAAIDSHVDLLLGEGRFPTITARASEDDSEWDPSGLAQDDSALLDRFVVELAHETCLRPHLRDIAAQALGCGTAVGILGHRNGKLTAEITRAKWCTPKFHGDDPDCLESLEIRYPYLDAQRLPNGKLQARCLLYRRVIDAESDVVFKPAPADKLLSEPVWSVATKTDHGYGFCPVLWYPLLKTASTITQIDGTPIHAHILEALVGLDTAVSQKHTAALFAGSPQICEFGVPEGFTPTETGRPFQVPASRMGGATDVRDPAANPLSGSYQEFGAKAAARKKGPGYVWQYPSTESRVEMLALDGAALKALDDHANDLRIKIYDALAFVPIDPEHTKFAAALSGKALESLRARQLDRVDKLRDDIGEKYIVPAVCMLLRIAQRARAVLATPGLARVEALLDRFSVEMR